VSVWQQPGDDRRSMRVWDAAKKTFNDSECRLQGRRPSEEGALSGRCCQACQQGGGWLPWRVPNDAMGSENKLGTTTEVGDNNGDTTSGIEAEGRVRDRVGDGDDATSRELVV
jgi:hypothetical protein